MRLHRLLYLFGFLVLSASPARGEEVVIETKPVFSTTTPVRNYVNLRAGAVASQSASGKHPDICLEVSPLSRLALESCGTGSGFLHTDNEPELAHFRGHWSLADWRWDKAWIHPRVGAGFAELQMGPDKPGFHFGDAGGGIETAGPEALGSLQMLYGMPAGFEMVAEVHAGAAYLAYAPELTIAQPTTQPFGGFTLGVGW
jgi:hypothetical protein